MNLIRNIVLFANSEGSCYYCIDRWYYIIRTSEFLFCYIHSFLVVHLLHFHLLAVVKDLKYADSHEWVKVDGNSATVGITDHAQDHLGDVVYVELPEVGAAVKQGEGFGAVESVKATSDVYSPVSGKVIEVNEELGNSPGLVGTLGLCYF